MLFALSGSGTTISYVQKVFKRYDFQKQILRLKNFEIQPEIDKNGTVDKVIAKDDLVLLQITKEPISTKGPRISTQISLTGRFLVLIPFDNKVSISKKVKSSEEKKD
jgi:ribonuclease G